MQSVAWMGDHRTSGKSYIKKSLLGRSKHMKDGNLRDYIKRNWIRPKSNGIKKMTGVFFLHFIFTANFATGPPHGSGAWKRIRSVQGAPGAPELLGPKLEQTEHSIPNRGTASTSVLFGQKFRKLLTDAKLCSTKHLSYINPLRQNYFFLILLLFLAPDVASVAL